jgi:hypothetical protein
LKPTVPPTYPPTVAPTFTPTIAQKCFETTLELKDAAFQGYSDSANAAGLSVITSIYGPIENWCVDKIYDFSMIFASYD